MKKSLCEEEREKYEEAQKRVKELSEKFNDLLLRLQELIDERKRLVFNAQRSLGAQFVAHILTLPVDKIGVLGDLLQRYFGNIISNKLFQAADNFMKQSWAIKKKIKYTEGQIVIVFTQLERAAKELEKFKERLKKCEEKRK